MDEELSYRAELADQFLAGLRSLSAEQWRELVSHGDGTGNYFALALELADEATRLLGSERSAQVSNALSSRLTTLDGVLAGLAPRLPGTTEAVARRLAHAALHAFLVRDAYGFNSGAFGELIRPFRPYVDLAGLERSASRVRTPPGGAVPFSPAPPHEAR